MVLHLNVEEGLVEVGDNVLDIFDADGQAHQTFGDSDALADFDRHGSVSH